MLEVIGDLILKHAKKTYLDAVEAFLQRKILKRIEINKNQIKKVSEQELSGFAVRSIVNKRMGFVSSNSSNNIEDTVDLSAQNARISLQKVGDNFVNRKAITQVQNIRDDRFRDLSLEEMSDIIIDILKSIETSRPVKNLAGSVLLEIEERMVVNSEGLWKREVGTRQFAELETTIQVDDFLGVGTSYLISRELHQKWQELFNSSIKSAYSQQKRKKISLTKPSAVILSSDALAQILAFSMVPSFYLTNQNIQYDSIRKRNFTKELVIVDDPTIPDAMNTFGFDDEGFPSKPQTIVSGGKCKQLLGMNFACSDRSERAKYLGNCYRVTSMSKDSRSYSYPPVISASNLVLESRSPISDEIFGYLSDGLYIKQITGAQDANYFSGEFNCTVTEGYEISNGEITNPILPCFCSGNIYNILGDSSIIISNKAKQVPIPATPLIIMAPELLTSRMTITI